MPAHALLPPDPRAHPRVVLGARGLLYVWDDAAIADVLTGLRDEHWRVREMCLKVAIRRRLVERVDTLERLLRDENHRVRAAARRALRTER